MGLLNFFMPKNKEDVLRLLRMVAAVDPRAREAAEVTEKIIKDVDNWKKGVIQYADDHGYKMQDVLELLQQHKGLISKYLPNSITQEIVSTLSELTDAQNRIGKQVHSQAQSQSSTSVSTREKYKIIPIS